MQQILKTIVIITSILASAYITNVFITQRVFLEAIKDCSGSPSCIESTASVILYRSTPCLDTYGSKR